MICKVVNTIEKHKMLNGVRSVAVGLSGGADSMCLIDILIKLKVQYGIIVKAVHVNHNIRGEEALRDENHVKAYCKSKGIELLTFSIDVPKLSKEFGISEEECGRKVRYECFRKAKCDKIATAHTLSDSVETIVFNLLRGTGSKGLSGISANRDDVIRPLIDCTRAEIEDYCKSENLGFVTDSTNLTDDYSRNYLRNRILPLFSEINPSSFTAITKLGEIVKEESGFIEMEALKLISESCVENGYSKAAFLYSHPAVRKRAFRILLEKRMNKPVEYRHISLCEESILYKNSRIELARDLYISFESDIIHFCGAETAESSWSSEFENFTAETPYGKFELIRSQDKSGIDISKIKNKLTLSSRKERDRIYLKKRKVTKSLKKLFNEMKIPAAERNRIAVLRDGENVVWVEGVGIDGNYLLNEKSSEAYVIIKDGQRLW